MFCMVDQVQAFLPCTPPQEKNGNLAADVTARLVLTRPRGMDFAGLAARSIPILSKEQGRTEKLQESCLPPLLLPNSVNFGQTWPQLIWETLNSKELEGCTLAVLWKTQILCWETGSARAELQASPCESWVIWEWMTEKNWAAFYPVCCVSSYVNKNWDTSPRVKLCSEGHMK